MSVVRHILRIFPPHVSCFVVQAEDWQSDKCDVYMSEAHAEGYILRMLDEACDWLRRSPKGKHTLTMFQSPSSNTILARSFWRNALFQRLNLRKVGQKILFISHALNLMLGPCATSGSPAIERILPLPPSHRQGAWTSTTNTDLTTSTATHIFSCSTRFRSPVSSRSRFHNTPPYHSAPRAGQGLG